MSLTLALLLKKWNSKPVLNPLNIKPQLLFLKNGDDSTYLAGTLWEIIKMDIFRMWVRVYPSSGLNLQWLPTSFQIISKFLPWLTSPWYDLPLHCPIDVPWNYQAHLPQGLCTCSSLSGLLFCMCVFAHARTRAHTHTCIDIILTLSGFLGFLYLHIYQFLLYWVFLFIIKIPLRI